MEKSTIIKLRQSEANEVDVNGSYRVSLSKGITLEEGDEVRVHSVILDTSAESVVTLDKDVPVVMGVAKYIRNFDGVNAVPFSPGVVPYELPDLKNQVLCTRQEFTGNEFDVGFIVVEPTGSREIDDGTKSKGPYISTWQFTDPATGKITQRTIPIGPYKARKHRSKNIIQAVSFFVKGKSFVCLDSVKDLRKHGIDPFVFVQNIVSEADIDVFGNGGVCFMNSGNPVAAGTGFLSVREEVCEFTIPAGAYEPAELAQIVNDNMTKIDTLGPVGADYTNFAFPINNPFLSTIAQQHHTITAASPEGLGREMWFNPEVTAEDEDVNGIQFISDAAIAAMVGPATDFLIGGNQVSMNYDENLKKLNFDSLHQPIYVVPNGTATGVPGIMFPPTPQVMPVFPTTTPPTTKSVAVAQEVQVSRGGNFFTRLLPTSFWATLGFNDIVVPTPNGPKSVELENADVIFPLLINLELGKNIVGALPTIDIFAQKINTPPAGGLAPVLQDTENSFTTPILASRRFNEISVDEGYYLLEIGFKLPQTMIGGHLNDNSQTGSNRVQSIITKYFTSGNFLQDTGTGSVVYTHHGEPQMLNDLDVKIVHPDFSSPSNDELGNKNSVFLEVIKAVRPQFTPPSQMK